MRKGGWLQFESASFAPTASFLLIVTGILTVVGLALVMGSPTSIREAAGQSATAPSASESESRNHDAGVLLSALEEPQSSEDAFPGQEDSGDRIDQTTVRLLAEEEAHSVYAAEGSTEVEEICVIVVNHEFTDDLTGRPSHIISCQPLASFYARGAFLAEESWHGTERHTLVLGVLPDGLTNVRLEGPQDISLELRGNVSFVRGQNPGEQVVTLAGDRSDGEPFRRRLDVFSAMSNPVPDATEAGESSRHE